MSKMRHWVLVNRYSNTVENLIDWEGPEVAPCTFEDYITPVEYFEGDKNVCIGATYKDGVFSVDDERGYIAEVNANLLQYNRDLKSYLLRRANTIITILNSMVTVGINLDDDATYLLLWQKYQASLCQGDWRKTDRKVIWPPAPLLPSYLRDLHL